jgi:hypothetical protein
MLPMMAFVQGCSTDSTHDGGGAGHSALEYVNNTLKVSENMPLNLVLDAANGALLELQIPTQMDRRVRSHITLQGQDTKSQLVSVQLIGINRFTTEVRIVVGTTDSTENRAEEHLIYDKMKDRY